MLHMIIGNLYGSCIITEKKCGGITRNNTKLANNHRSHTISEVVVATARSSTFVLDQDTAACFLDIHARGDKPRRMQYPVTE